MFKQHTLNFLLNNLIYCLYSFCIQYLITQSFYVGEIAGSTIVLLTLHTLGCVVAGPGQEMHRYIQHKPIIYL